MQVTLLLSDPWEMGNALGWPKITARVVHRGTNAWLLELLAPFTYANIEYCFIVVSARHEGRTLADAIANEVSCNMIRVPRDQALARDPCDVSWWRGGAAMIGSIHAIG